MISRLAALLLLMVKTKVSLLAERGRLALSKNTSISISVMGKTMMEFQERSGWVLRKPYAPAFGFKNTHFLPQRGKKCSVSGFTLLSFREEPCPLSL
jgi:hypothetical protein